MRIATLALVALAGPLKGVDSFCNIKSLSLVPRNTNRSSLQVSPITEEMSEILFNKQDDTVTKIDNVRDSFGFRNDGKYWFMKTLMGVYEEGTQVVNGLPQQKTTAIVSEDEASKRREIATNELVNIDADERQRRVDLGNKFLAVAAIYAAYLVYFVDQGDAFGHFVRFSVFPFYATGYGLRESGKAGL